MRNLLAKLNDKKELIMDLLEYYDNLENEALNILQITGAIRVCRLHKDIQIRNGDEVLEKRAYAIGTKQIGSGAIDGERSDLMDAIKNVLDQAADDECPECARLRDA